MGLGLNRLPEGLFVGLNGNVWTGTSVDIIIALCQWNVPRGTLWGHFQVMWCPLFCNIVSSLVSTMTKNMKLYICCRLYLTCIYCLCAFCTYTFFSPMTRKTMHPPSTTSTIATIMMATTVVTVLSWGVVATAACVNTLSKQCGEVSCGTVSPHGPGSMKNMPPLIVIWTLPSCLVNRLDRLAFKDVRSTASGRSNEVKSLALKMT